MIFTKRFVLFEKNVRQTIGYALRRTYWWIRTGNIGLEITHKTDGIEEGTRRTGLGQSLTTNTDEVLLAVGWVWQDDRIHWIIRGWAVQLDAVDGTCYVTL